MKTADEIANENRQAAAYLADNRKPDASSQPSFAERVAELERMVRDAQGRYDDDPSGDRVIETMRLSISAIREQQAALEKVTSACGSHENWNGETREFLIACEAVLARWRIE